MNVMYINECRPLAKKCFTEKYGTNQCMLAVRENLMKQFGVSVDETVLERVIRHGTADISQRYLTAIRDTATEYAEGIFRRLREHEYDPELMRLYVVGGGSCMRRSSSNSFMRSDLPHMELFKVSMRSLSTDTRSCNSSGVVSLFCMR